MQVAGCWCATPLSAITYIALLLGPIKLGPISFDVHTLFFAGTGLVLGYLAIACGIVIRMFGIREGLLQEHLALEKLRASPALELGGAIGLSLMLGGLILGFFALSAWSATGFGNLRPGELLRQISISITLVQLGGVTLMAALIVGFLALPTSGERQ